MADDTHGWGYQKSSKSAAQAGAKGAKRADVAGAKLPLSSLLGLPSGEIESLSAASTAPSNAASEHGRVGENIRVLPWPKYAVTPELGCRSARGCMEVGEQHSGVKSGVSYTIRRIR